MSVAVLIPAGAPCPHRDAALDWVTAWWARHFPDFEIVVERDPSEPFSRSRTANAARARTDATTLILADGDVWLTPDVLRAAVTASIDTGWWGWPWSECRRLSHAVTCDVLAGPPTADGPDTCERLTGAAAGGLSVYPAAVWDAVDGMDPRFEGWGGEDNAFAHALGRIVGPGQRLDGPLWHLWHPPAPTRGKGATYEANLALYGEYRRARTPEAMRKVLAERPPR